MVRDGRGPTPLFWWKRKVRVGIFCVDYKTLNKIIVPNKFTIPVIDGLLDKVQRCVEIFSKLYLKLGYY